MINAGYQGSVERIFDEERERRERRMAICAKCPLYTRDPMLGAICDHRKYVGRNGIVTDYPTPGAVNGCGCKLLAKTSLRDEKCVLNKW